VALKERVNKLCDRLLLQDAELDRLIERLGPEEALKVIEELVKEYNADEPEVTA